MREKIRRLILEGKTDKEIIDILSVDDRVGDKIRFHFPPNTDISTLFYNKYPGFKRRVERMPLNKNNRSRGRILHIE